MSMAPTRTQKDPRAATELVKSKPAEPTLSMYAAGVGTLGNILINPDVIARIAGMAAAEVEGVSLGQKFSLVDILPSKEVVKGIQVVQTESGGYTIVCEVKMAYNTPMRETAERLQRHVKETVERMTSMTLDSIDVRIVDVFVEKDKKDKDSEN